MTIREKYAYIVSELTSKGKTISTMESCTGGCISSAITDIQGSSSVISEAFVTYSNSAKIKQGVSAETIKKYGVYSKETAIAMATACKNTSNADIGIGVTGSFETLDALNNDSLPGTVFVGIVNDDDSVCYCFHVNTNISRHAAKMFIAELIANKLIDLLGAE